MIHLSQCVLLYFNFFQRTLYNVFCFFLRNNTDSIDISDYNISRFYTDTSTTDWNIDGSRTALGCRTAGKALRIDRKA